MKVGVAKEKLGIMKKCGLAMARVARLVDKPMRTLSMVYVIGISTRPPRVLARTPAMAGPLFS